MAKIEDCPEFETFGADVKARKEKHLARKDLAEMEATVFNDRLEFIVQL